MNSRYHLNRFLLACGAAAALALMWFLGATFQIPYHRGFEDSLLRQPNAVVAVIVMIVGVVISTIACTIVAGSVRADAGLFCAALGLMSLSLRAGPMRYVLFESSGSVFYVLCVELALLFVALYIAWFVVGRMAAMGLTRQNDPDYEPDDEITLDQKFLTMALAVCATATVLGLLARTDAKAQSLAAVFVSSAIGAGVAVMIAPVRRSVWYWPAPLVVGLIGYIWSSFSPENLAIGQPSGYFAALARPLPLDYASAGVAGAMLGYWLSRAWTRADETAPADPAGTPAGN